jgi:hypothetical protein
MGSIGGLFEFWCKLCEGRNAVISACAFSASYKIPAFTPELLGELSSP